MLTEKDIEHIEDYIRGNLDANIQAELKEKIAVDPIYKNKYNELKVLSEAIQEYEKHKHIFEQIKNKKNDISYSSLKLFSFKHFYKIRNLSIAASVLIIVGVVLYKNVGLHSNMIEYGAPSNSISDSLEIDSLEMKKDSL